MTLRVLTDGLKPCLLFRNTMTKPQHDAPETDVPSQALTPGEPLQAAQSTDSATHGQPLPDLGSGRFSHPENDGNSSTDECREPVKNHEKPKSRFSQSQNILDKFGGARRLSELFKAMGRPRHPATIYKWTYARQAGGTDGLIPSSAWADVLHAARLEGILITPDDLNPAPRDLGEL